MASQSEIPKVVVVGSSNTDMVVASKRLPKRGETVLGGHFYQAAGGKGANQAVAAARAGVRTEFIGCFGNDAMGRQAMTNLAAEGIDLKHAVSLDGVSSGVALILVDEEGSNLIAVAPGANARLEPAMIDRARESIKGADVVLMQLEVPLAAAERAAEHAAAGGAVLLLNPAPVPSVPLPAPFLERVSILIANEEETAAMAAFGEAGGNEPEDAAGRLLDSGVGKVIATLGRRGGRVWEGGGKSWTYDGIRAVAVDTVAAGDCFCGWLAAMVAEGRSLESAVEFAARAAALSVTRRGAQPSLPGRNEVLT